MKLSRQILFASSITLAAVVVPHLATAAEHIVEMRNRDDAKNSMAFQPGFVKVEVGDTVKFVPTDKSHNTESVREPRQDQRVQGDRACQEAARRRNRESRSVTRTA